MYEGVKDFCSRGASWESDNAHLAASVPDISETCLPHPSVPEYQPPHHSPRVMFGFDLGLLSQSHLVLRHP